MTTITYSNGGGIHAFPSTAFAANGNLSHSSGDVDTFTITQAGTTNLYEIDLVGTGFTYDEGGHPTGGTITEVQIEDASGSVYVDMRSFGQGSNTNLALFWTTLQSSGPKAALNDLVGDNATVYGSSDGDQVETYGQFGNYTLGGGNVVLDIFDSYTQAVAGDQTIGGGPGSDTFQIELGGLAGLDLQGGPTAPGKVNTIDFHAPGTLAFANIAGFTSFTFTAAGVGKPFDQFIYLNTDQLPGGTTPVFQVTGSAANHGNEIVIEPSPAGQNLNFSDVTVSDFTRLNQAFWFDFASTSNDNVIGVPDARNVFHFGGGNNHATGGMLDDVLIASRGHDTFHGGGGIDVVQYHAGIGAYTVTKLGAHEYRVHDNRAGSPDGTDILFNVAYLEFTNATVYIGGKVATTSTLSALHTHDLAATSVHHFDLFA
jgi:hypothetical protein